MTRAEVPAAAMSVASEPLRERVAVCGALAAPVVAMAAVPALRFPDWPWVCLVLTAPVVVWGGLPFHRGAWAALRRGAVTADSVASPAVVAALGWSLAALLSGDGFGPARLLAVAAGVTVLVLAARHGAARVGSRLGPDDGPAARAVVPHVVVVLAVGALGFALGAGADGSSATSAAIAVLVVGCAVGPATSVPLLAGTGRAARLGIGIGDRRTPAAARRADTVVLGPGILTSGERTLVETAVAEDADAGEVLRLAAAVEQESAHPLARAVVRAADADGRLPGVADFDEVPGRGVRGVVAEVHGDTVVAHAVLVGHPAFLAEHDVALPPDLSAAQAAATAAGHTPVAVAWDGVARGLLAVGHAVPHTAARAVRRLRSLGLASVLVTTGSPAAARSVAEQAGIDADAVVADVPPGGRTSVVRRLQAEGRTVAVLVGGEDAAPVDADLVLVAGRGTDPATGSPLLALPRDDLPAALDAIRLVRRTAAVARDVRGCGLAVAVAALPPAAAGLLDPVLAAAAVALVPVFALLDSTRLWLFRPTR
ncbi:HAD family hydrolase [Pseudonocardia nigra]|uniref:HAD family hydrolase n=1 Tax=Pseudonocardia nigra TaxID=1921578 RepID=UPI001C5E04C1|nr:HAD family hydrolase [Pseudonocardia nigra]